jgi:hypothetical protein
MPTSHFQQLNEIMRLVMICKPKSVLDIGVGFGKYGVLCREYLELWSGYSQQEIRLDGIEVFQKYLGRLHDHVYDQIFVGNALDVLLQSRYYNIVLLIDILEHFRFEDGLKLLTMCRNVADNVLVSTPREFKPQNPEFGNEWEIHRSHWEIGDFDDFKPVFEMPQKESLIVFFGNDVKKIERNVK